MARRLNNQAKDKGRVLYLYGIGKMSVGEVPKVAGVDGSAAVEAIPCGALACWISRVAKREFGDELAKNMENLEWLAAVSVQHQRVVSAIGQGRSILPTRFGTVFLSDASLKKHVESRKRLLESELKRIEGTDEWGVKVFQLPSLAQPEPVAKSGKDYLSAKAASLRSRPKRDAEIERFIAGLKAISVDTVEGGGISSAQPGVQWNGSALLRRTDKKKLDELLAQFSHEWQDVRRIECTGPWPPYSFVSRGGGEHD